MFGFWKLWASTVEGQGRRRITFLFFKWRRLRDRDTVLLWNWQLLNGFFLVVTNQLLDGLFSISLLNKIQTIYIIKVKNSTFNFLQIWILYYGWVWDPWHLPTSLLIVFSFWQFLLLVFTHRHSSFLRSSLAWIIVGLHIPLVFLFGFMTEPGPLHSWKALRLICRMRSEFRIETTFNRFLNIHLKLNSYNLYSLTIFDKLI